MKSLIFGLVQTLLLASLYGCFEAEKKVASQPDADQPESAQALPDELKDPEDCDEKAKKAEEAVEVNLGGGGDAGCTIE